MKNIEKTKLRNLQRAIVNASKKVKEKVIAVDRETFGDIYGKEIKLKFPTEVLESMEKELELEVEEK